MNYIAFSQHPDKFTQELVDLHDFKSSVKHLLLEPHEALLTALAERLPGGLAADISCEEDRVIDMHFITAERGPEILDFLFYKETESEGNDLFCIIDHSAIQEDILIKAEYTAKENGYIIIKKQMSVWSSHKSNRYHCAHIRAWLP